MPTAKHAAEARRHAARVHRSLSDDVRRLREDAGATRLQLASAAGVDDAYLGRIEDGNERPSIDTYAKLAIALGSDLSARLYPNTGPALRDRHQARIVEALIGILHARWKPYLEVGVRRPSRGWIDAVLHEAVARTIVATEIQSDLRTARAAAQVVPGEGGIAAVVGWVGAARGDNHDVTAAHCAVDEGD